MKRILITGASGFIGRHVTKLLLDLGFEVYSERINLFDVKSVQDRMQKLRPTHLLHLAWITKPGVFFESPENIRWVEATLALARAFVESGGQRFVGAGTCSEMFETFYGFCKNETRVLLEKYCSKMGIEFAWGRVYFLYGPYEKPERLIPSVITGLLKNKPVACSDGYQIRDYMDVRECAQCFADLVDSHENGIFEIASGKPIRLREFILAFAHALGRPDLIQFGARPERLGEPKVIIAQKPFLFQSRTGFLESVAQTIEYWRRIT